MDADEQLRDALRRSAWDAVAKSGEGLGFVFLARSLGVRIPAVWDAVAWLLEGGYLVVRDGRLRVPEVTGGS